MIGKEYLDGYEKRVLHYPATADETPDRAGDIVRVAGANFDNYYPKNPVVMFAHQHDNFPVGAAVRIGVDKVNKTIPADALFLDNRVDSSGRSDLVYKFAASNFLPACSVGFLPHDGGTNSPVDNAERNRLGLGKGGAEYKSFDYLEFSPCGIPMNPNSVKSVVTTLKKDVTFEKADFDLLYKYKWMEVNLLDLFSDLVIGKKTKIFVLPKIEIEVKGVIPYAEHSKAPKETAWDGAAQRTAADVKDLKIMCAWYDASAPDVKGSYKLPHHEKEGYHTVYNGVRAAMNALLGGRGGVDMPEGDKAGVHTHLARHLKEFGEEAPENKVYNEKELKAFFPELYKKEAVGMKTAKTKSIANRTAHDLAYTGIEILHQGMLSEIHEKAFDITKADDDEECMAKAILDDHHKCVMPHVKNLIKCLRGKSMEAEPQPDNDSPVPMTKEEAKAWLDSKVKQAVNVEVDMTGFNSYVEGLTKLTTEFKAVQTKLETLKTKGVASPSDDGAPGCGKGKGKDLYAEILEGVKFNIGNK
jgi:hypothetical protein